MKASRFNIGPLGMLLLAAGLSILLSAPAKSQQECPLSISATFAPVQQLSISDVDFEHFESHTLLFTLRIANAGTAEATTRLIIRMDVRLANGSVYDRAVYFRSKEFTIPPGVQIITNLDIGRSGRIQQDEFELSDPAKNDIQDVAFSTGKFPPGNYLYFFQLEEPSCPEVSTEVDLIIENPTRVELRSPKDGEITGMFPLFEFYHDGTKAVLTVAEISAGQSREDAITKEPPMNSVELVGQNSYLYSGGRPLEEGKSYVWKVVSKTTGPSGSTIEVSSPVGLFNVAGTGTGEEVSTSDELFRLLEEMFASKYPDIIEQLRTGAFTYESFSQNGSGLSKAEIIALLRDLQESGVDITLVFE